MKSKEELEREEWNLDHNYRVMKDFYRRERERTPEGIAWSRFKDKVSTVVEWVVYAVLIWAVCYAVIGLIR